MDSDLQQYTNHFKQKEQMTTGGGLTRYRSAPSSYFSTFMEAATDNISGAVSGEFSQPPPQPRPLSPETESILARFMDNITDGSGSGSTSRENKLYDIPEYSPVVQPQFLGPAKEETDQIQSFTSNNNHIINSNNNTNNLPSSSQINYQPNSNPIESNFSLPNSGGRSNSNLVRHRSSPAGLFDNITIEDGYLVNKDTGPGSFRSGGKSQINFSGGENQMAAGRSFNKSEDDGFMTGFPDEKWNNDSPIFSPPEGSGGDFNSPENQNGQGRSRRGGLLAHHLSLPKGSMEKLLQFQDSVPCKLRAKRGFATHPRSIAERVRRTKISERMRKLQDLVPNMDKQTNTSDMLDLAVDYIKELQKQVKTLKEKQEKCSCTS